VQLLNAPARNVHGVTLVRLGAVTHQFDQGQLYVPLDTYDHETNAPTMTLIGPPAFGRMSFLVSSLGLAACGPRTTGDEADWMLGTFSEFGEGAERVYTFSGLDKLTFEREGVGTYTSLGACGRDVSETAFSWEQREDGAIAIVPEPGEDHVFTTQEDEWRLAPTGRCNPLGFEEITLQEVRDGRITQERSIYRGDLCLERFECSESSGDSQCDDCQTVWCDDVPPPCGD